MEYQRQPDPTDADGERDLRFRPAEPTAATTLDAEQVAHYNQNGFVSPIDLFASSEIAEIRRYFDGLLEEVIGADDPRNAYSINGYHHVCEPLYDLATDERVVSLVTDIIGSQAVCWGSHLFAKLPGDPKEVPHHQDANYWPFTPSKSVTVWIAIDDVDADNGAMTFVPGSHRSGGLGHDDLGLDGSRVLPRRVRDHELAAFGEGRFLNELRAGQCSLHSDLLLHGSAANTSDRRRAGMTLRYIAAEARLIPGYDQVAKFCFHVADGDPSGFWGNRRPPSGSRPDLMAEFWGDFDGQPLDAS